MLATIRTDPNIFLLFFFFFLNSLYTFVCSQASYGVEDPEYAVTQLAQTTMRSELGKLTLDKVFRVKTNCCFISYFFSVHEGTSCILSLHLFLRKGSLWIPTSSIPSTKLQTSGESVAFVTKSKIYTFHLVSKSPCRCRWEKQKSFLKHNF